MGYSLDEIKGKHHSMFVDEAYRAQRRVSRVLGQAQPRRIPGRRIQAHRQGRQGSLDPGFLQPDPRPQRQAVQGRQVRHATSPRRKTTNADYAGQIAAISKSQAVIEFNMDGTIVQANDNFLRALGYIARRDQRQASRHLRRGKLPQQPRLPRILGEIESGRISRAANTSASAKAAAKSGSRPPTTLFSISTASRSKSSNTPPTSRRKKPLPKNCAAKLTPCSSPSRRRRAAISPRKSPSAARTPSARWARALAAALQPAHQHQQDRPDRRDALHFLRRTLHRQPADERQRRRNLRASQRRLRRRRTGQPQPPDRRHRQRRNERLASRKSPRTPPKPPRSPPKP